MKKNDNPKRPSVFISVNRKPVSGELYAITWFINSKQKHLSCLKKNKKNENTSIKKKTQNIISLLPLPESNHYYSFEIEILSFLHSTFDEGK